MREQAFGYLPPGNSVDGVDAPALQCGRLAIERAADEELSVRSDVHVERKQSTAAAHVTVELCARPARKGHDQMTVRHDRVQCRHHDPGFVARHASIEPRFDAGQCACELRLAHGMFDVRVNSADLGFELGEVLP